MSRVHLRGEEAERYKIEETQFLFAGEAEKLHLRSAAIRDRTLAEASRLCKRRCCAARIEWLDAKFSIHSAACVNGTNSYDCSAEGGACGCPHAELKLLIGTSIPEYIQARMITTLSPCASCAWAIVLTRRINVVYYLEAYDKDLKGLAILQDHNVRTVKL